MLCYKTIWTTELRFLVKVQRIWLGIVILIDISNQTYPHWVYWLSHWCPLSVSQDGCCGGQDTAGEKLHLEHPLCPGKLGWSWISKKSCLNYFYFHLNWSLFLIKSGLQKKIHRSSKMSINVYVPVENVYHHQNLWILKSDPCSPLW